MTFVLGLNYSWNNTVEIIKQEKSFITLIMSSAPSFKHQQPRFMAVKTEEKQSESTIVNKQKKEKINIGILATWVIVIVLTIIFWYLILKLF